MLQLLARGSELLALLARSLARLLARFLWFAQENPASVCPTSIRHLPLLGRSGGKTFMNELI